MTVEDDFDIEEFNKTHPSVDDRVTVKDDFDIEKKHSDQLTIEQLKR